jgi:hypothetical protein
MFVYIRLDEYLQCNKFNAVNKYNNNSIQLFFTLKPNSPEAKYEVSMSKEKETKT